MTGGLCSLSGGAMAPARGRAPWRTELMTNRLLPPSTIPTSLWTTARTLLIGFATQRRDASSSDPYFREVFALARGTSGKHRDFLHVAFDHDEALVLDAIRLLRASS